MFRHNYSPQTQPRNVLKSCLIALAISVPSIGVCNDVIDSPRERQAATTINSLSSTLLDARLAQDGVSNALVSSVSLYYALSILELGAAADSADVLRRLLLHDPTLDVARIAAPLAQSMTSPIGEGGNRVAGFVLSNSIWSTNGNSSGHPFVFSEQFKADTKNFYSAQAETLDFEANGASSTVNEWVAEATNGLIDNVIDDATLSELVWLVINTAYFEGTWAERLGMARIAENADYNFKGLNGSLTPADTVKNAVRFTAPVLDMEDGSVAFSLPYGGGKYAFVSYVPAESEMDVEKWLRDVGVAGMLDVAQRVFRDQNPNYELTVQMPVFSFEDRLEISKDSAFVEDLGAELIFSDAAEFRRVVDVEKTATDLQLTKVDLIKQQTKIEFDEVGVKAAAATIIETMVITSARKSSLPTRDIIVDRPFAFAIVENSSGAILFNGILVQPGKSGD